ncbi:hypothetical protein HYPSUDRAFT_201548 [Hypholoma sublateritium FD-334 SS-4]|uniref:Uncharacterized protein n=1 Tax=Hypholoma sublateritium (strain FD-334 SS-4) TaxID=945553 RepID=A0A0D2MHZ4_HYPSF|nr:hypothetical protein HYPSUDRAFT_201548 [Hypholoma sublateritium FD-334 SS-4]
MPVPPNGPLSAPSASPNDAAVVPVRVSQLPQELFFDIGPALPPPHHPTTPNDAATAGSLSERSLPGQDACELRCSRRCRSLLPNPADIQERRGGTCAGIATPTAVRPSPLRLCGFRERHHSAYGSFDARVGAVFFRPTAPEPDTAAFTPA